MIQDHLLGFPSAILHGSAAHFKANQTPVWLDWFLSRNSFMGGGEPALQSIRLKFELGSSWEKDSSGKKQTLVKLKINASTVRFETVNGLHSGRLRIAVFCTDSDGGLMADGWENLDMNLSEETYRSVLQKGIPHSVLLPVSPGRRSFKAIVYEVAGDKVGSRTRNIN